MPYFGFVANGTIVVNFCCCMNEVGCGLDDLGKDDFLLLFEGLLASIQDL